MSPKADKRNQRLSEVEGKQPPLEPQPERKHCDQGDQEREPLLTSTQPQVAGAGNQPGSGKDYVDVGGRLGPIGRGGAHCS